jgi:hypothetical protein
MAIVITIKGYNSLNTLGSAHFWLQYIVGPNKSAANDDSPHYLTSLIAKHSLLRKAA